MVFLVNIKQTSFLRRGISCSYHRSTPLSSIWLSVGLGGKRFKKIGIVGGGVTRIGDGWLMRGFLIKLPLEYPREQQKFILHIFVLNKNVHTAFF